MNWVAILSLKIVKETATDSQIGLIYYFAEAQMQEILCFNHIIHLLLHSR